jgi:hypothetical protein
MNEPPAFVVRVVDDEARALADALLEMPIATDEELTRLSFTREGESDAALMVVEGAPASDAAETVRALGDVVFVAVEKADDDAIDAWAKIVPPERVHRARDVDQLRAALLETALSRIDVSIARARRAKRPYALSIVAGASLLTAAEAFLPGAAAFVVASQASAISSLFFLYTGRWMGRTQALALLPAFAAEAAGGSTFLLVKSFLPPTGVVDAVAAGVAASMTLTVLGTIAFALDHGWSLEEKEQLRAAFRKMRARTKAERRSIVANAHKWTDKQFWIDLARRVIFPQGS